MITINVRYNKQHSGSAVFCLHIQWIVIRFYNERRFRKCNEYLMFKIKRRSESISLALGFSKRSAIVNVILKLTCKCFSTDYILMS